MGELWSSQQVYRLNKGVLSWLAVVIVGWTVPSGLTSCQREKQPTVILALFGGVPLPLAQQPGTHLAVIRFATTPKSLFQ